MKYKVGDEVRVKSLEWYEKNKNSFGNVSSKDHDLGFPSAAMSLCGKELTIKAEGGMGSYYHVEETSFLFQDWMFEDNAEDDDTETETSQYFLVENLLKDLDIEDYTQVRKIEDFDEDYYYQSITTKEYILFWHIGGDRILVVRKVGIFHII